MTKQYTPILTAYFFVLKTHLEDELETVLLNIKESGITVKVYEPNDELLNINPKNPRVYVSLGILGRIPITYDYHFTKEKDGYIFNHQKISNLDNCSIVG